jgi:hypothetical protein
MLPNAGLVDFFDIYMSKADIDLGVFSFKFCEIAFNKR